jgi:protein-S-isoprenylcysteine O-methyltransferase Ste14
MQGGGMKEKKGEHPFGDAGQLICAAVFLSVWVADSFFLHTSTLVASYVPITLRLAILGITLVTSLLLLRSAHFVVTLPHRPNEVVSRGAFRYVRHPLYLASLLFYLGLTISTTSLFSLLVMAGSFLFYNYIAHYEELLLEQRFGEVYRSYKNKTGKWMPKIFKV